MSIQCQVSTQNNNFGSPQFCLWTLVKIDLNRNLGLLMLCMERAFQTGFHNITKWSREIPQASPFSLHMRNPYLMKIKNLILVFSIISFISMSSPFCILIYKHQQKYYSGHSYSSQNSLKTYYIFSATTIFLPTLPLNQTIMDS